MRFSVFAMSLACLVIIAQPVIAREKPQLDQGSAEMLTGPARGKDLAKAATDSFLLIGPSGSGAPYLGGFENASGDPDWNGWTPVDETVTPNRWHTDDVDPPAGQYAAWCGESHTLWEGYGNNYDEFLVWRGQVTDPGAACTVNLTALVNTNVEAYYDRCCIGYIDAAGVHETWTHDGANLGLPVDLQFDYLPTDYTGASSDEVEVFFRVHSDGIYSDEDGENPTANPIGAMQVDNVVINLSNGAGMSHDFEDGTLGPLVPEPKEGFGNFGALWTGLQDRDDCGENSSVQVAFIDDGVIVPGTGGSSCTVPYCYGPGNFVVNTSGGLLGQGNGWLRNSIVSPQMAWPNPSHDDALLELSAYSDTKPPNALIVWRWSVRSTDQPNPQFLEEAPWLSNGLGYFDEAGYRRLAVDLSPYLVAHPTYVQLRLSVEDWSELYLFGDVASPGPYFDNVRLTTFAGGKPQLSISTRDLAQDGFLLSSGGVRFDTGRNLAGYGAFTAGDSVVFELATRLYATIEQAPRMLYRLEPNPLYDSERTAGIPAVGEIDCVSLSPDDDSGTIKFFADLPDSGFLFPGDILHYAFVVSDVRGGDVQTAVLPDTTGFADFSPLSSYSRYFTVRALPSYYGDLGQNQLQPPILFWDDYSQGETHRKWIEALVALGLEPGVDFDEFCTTAASSGTGNGLASLTTMDALGGYETILYTSGPLTSNTLVDKYANDAQVLETWLQIRHKNLLVMGDHLASDLASDAAIGSSFLEWRLGLNVVSEDLSLLIGDQRSPRVLSTGEHLVEADSWYIDGECPRYRGFDAALVSAPQTELIAGFADPGSEEISYPYVAASWTYWVTDDANLVYLPFGIDAMQEENPVAKVVWGPHLPLLRDILLEIFGQVVTDAPPAMTAATLRLQVGPNPFNPATVIFYEVPAPGRLRIEIIDVAGRRVAVLLDEWVHSNGKVMWKGADDKGAHTASGMYFCRLQFDGETLVRKLTLLK